jgi:GT2 family glycosyltransferase
LIAFIVPFRSDEPERKRSFEFVTNSLEIGFPNAPIYVSHMGDPFNRSASKNAGARLASANECDIFVFVDADSYVRFDQIYEACAFVRDGMPWALPYDVYYSLSQEGTENFYVGLNVGPNNCVHVFPSIETPEPAVGGCVVVSREAFETVHGYDERFIGWGWEDTSFALALEKLCGRSTRVPGPLHHLWHPSVELDCFDHDYLEHNRYLFHQYRDLPPDRLRALVQSR